MWESLFFLELFHCVLFDIILLEKIFEIKFEGLGCEDDVDDYDEMNFDAIENMET